MMTPDTLGTVGGIAMLLSVFVLSFSIPTAVSHFSSERAFNLAWIGTVVGTILFLGGFFLVAISQFEMGKVAL